MDLLVLIRGNMRKPIERLCESDQQIHRMVMNICYFFI